MNCIIIDDEMLCIKSLTNLLNTNFPQVKILASCSDSSKASALIVHHKPDFIFLDIEMPYFNGFDILAQFEHLNFDVIFTTAYDSYAIKAIKFSALDYLLKPIGLEDLAFAIEKLKNRVISISKTQLKIANAVNNKLHSDTIAFPTSDGLIFTPVNEIVHCCADSNYTRMYMLDKSVIMLSKTLGDVDELLSGYDFFRIHQSHLINLKHVKKYKRGDGGEVIMSNGNILLVSRNRKADFLNAFTRF
jgi:two-component system, LytTR family, response regulator